MSRRPLFFIAVILCLLTGLPAHPSGQRQPTLSGDRPRRAIASG
jgi:hypothetical protein